MQFIDATYAHSIAHWHKRQLLSLWVLDFFNPKFFNLISKLKKSKAYPDANMDESYTLKVANGVANLKANSVWGALRGMDTFSQLTYFATDKFGVQKVFSIYILFSRLKLLI